MFKTIVAVIDTSSAQQALIAHAVDFAGRYGARLHLVAVRATPIYWEVSLIDPMPGIVDQSDAEVEPRLREAIREAKRLGVFLDSHLLEGSVHKQIIRLAKRVGADLIMIGHMDRSFLSRILGGGAEQNLVRGAPCSVMVVNGVARRNRLSDAVLRESGTRLEMHTSTSSNLDIGVRSSQSRTSTSE